MRPQLLAPDSGHYEAASDGGGEHWAVIASLIETCKLCGVEPHAYLADVITRIVNGHLNRQIDDLLPRAYPTAHALKPWPENAAYHEGQTSRPLPFPAARHGHLRLGAESLTA